MKNIPDDHETKHGALSGRPVLSSEETIYLKYRPIEDLEPTDNIIPVEGVVDGKLNEPVSTHGNNESPSNVDGARSALYPW